jgi:membrane protein
MPKRLRSNGAHICLTSSEKSVASVASLLASSCDSAGAFSLPSRTARYSATESAFLDVWREMADAIAKAFVREQLRRLAEQGQTKLGLTSLAAFAIALWSANSGMKSMFEAMNVAYDEDEKRSFLRLTTVTLVFTLATFAAILLLIALIVVLPLVLHLVGLGTAAQWAARIGGVVLMLLLMMAGLAALYRFGPSRHAAQWRWITPGAALAIAVIVVASGLFTWYVASFGSFDATYGSLGAIFGFMTWLWIAAIIVIVGAEVNSEIEHQTRRDTTTGRPRPMGERGAVMANTIGPTFADAGAHAGAEAAPARRQSESLPIGRVALLAGLLWLQRRNGRSQPPS